MYIVIHVCITVLFLLKIQYEIKTEISAIPLTMGKRKKTLKTSSKLSAKIYVKLRENLDHQLFSYCCVLTLY